MASPFNLGRIARYYEIISRYRNINDMQELLADDIELHFKGPQELRSLKGYITVIEFIYNRWDQLIDHTSTNIIDFTMHQNKDENTVTYIVQQNLGIVLDPVMNYLCVVDKFTFESNYSGKIKSIDMTITDRRNVSTV